MKSRLFSIGLIGVSIPLLCVLAGYVALSWPHLSYEGSEVSPARYASMRARWTLNGPNHYRMVAYYNYLVGGCSEDVEIQNERVVKVYETDCNSAELFTVSDVFAMFDDFVGYGPRRPEASDSCHYYYVNAEFDPHTGYPRYLKNHLADVPTRGLYVAPPTFSCLAILPPHYTAVIESLTPLE